MTLNTLITRAASAYPDCYVMEYWDLGKQQPRPNPLGGDTLAQFVAQEIAETYDDEAGDTEHIATAVRKMREAARDLDAVANALAGLHQEKAA